MRLYKGKQSGERAMQLYKDYQPTQFDSKANFMGNTDSIDNWYVAPVIKTRDAKIFDEVNFEAVLELLGGEGDKVQVHSFGHWAFGWYELILVHPDLKTDLEKIEKRLDSYPLLNEDEYSNRVFNAACDYWDKASIRTRIQICKDNNISIFASRSDCLPDDIDYYSLIGE